MPFSNGINWAVLMFHKGTNWLSYLRLFAPGRDLRHSTMTDKINSTSLRWEGPAQRAQHSSSCWLKPDCRDKSLYPTHAGLYHLWQNDLSLQRLRFGMTKPEEPLASSMILLKMLEFGEATVFLSKWRQMGSHEFLPTPDPPSPARGLLAASQGWHRCHLSTLCLLATTPNPSQVWECYKDEETFLISLPSPGQHQWCAAHAWGLPFLIRDRVELV